MSHIVLRNSPAARSLWSMFFDTGPPPAGYRIYSDDLYEKHSTRRDVAEKLACARSLRGPNCVYVRNERTGYWSVFLKGKRRIIIRGRRRKKKARAA